MIKLSNPWLCLPGCYCFRELRMMEDEAASWLRIRRPLRLPRRMRRPMKSPRTWRSGERQQRRPSCPQWGRRHRRQLPTSGGRQPPKLRDSNRPAPSPAKDSPACQDHSSQTHCADGPFAEGKPFVFTSVKGYTTPKCLFFSPHTCKLGVSYCHWTCSHCCQFVVGVVAGVRRKCCGGCDSCSSCRF